MIVCQCSNSPALRAYTPAFFGSPVIGVPFRARSWPLRFSTAPVFLWRLRLQMVWANAATGAAEMIDLPSVRNMAPRFLKSEPVRGDILGTSNGKPAIAVVFTTHPNPALARLVHSAPEALRRRAHLETTTRRLFRRDVRSIPVAIPPQVVRVAVTPTPLLFGRVAALNRTGPRVKLLRHVVIVSRALAGL